MDWNRNSQRQRGHAQNRAETKKNDVGQGERNGCGGMEREENESRRACHPVRHADE